jgi:multidrug efflux pump subunit AcrA (membrane-fusion protein)
MPVVVGKAVEQAVATEIEVVGTVEPQLATTLSAEIAGLTMRFDLREGDVVQQGKTVIAQLKATDLELAVAEAEAELAKARETARKLKRGLRPEEIQEKRAEAQERKTWMEKYAKDLERARSMRTRDIASASEYDLAESTYLAAKAQFERVTQSLRVAELGARQEDIAAAEAEVQRLEARVKRLREDVQKTTLRSPVSGVITQRYTEVGQWLERGGKVVDVIDLRAVLVRVPVHEKDISRLRAGDEATIVLDALPDRPFTGRVKHIIPQADPASRTFPVKIEVPNSPDSAIKAGMFARVRLRAGTAQAGVFVPKDAVVRQPTGLVVFVVQEEKARLVPIKTGRSHDGLIEVIDGSVKPGDTVVVTGNETLRDQAAVMVKGNPRN